jgi:hypothetical protein
MRPGPFAAACVALLLAPPLAAAPQTVYRCGPDGRTFSQTPCSDGRALGVDDARSAAQQKAARDVAARDAEQARKLAEERRQREDAAKGQAAAGFRTAPAVAAAPASAPARKKKSNAAPHDPKMSPLMRVPPPPAAPR